MNSPYPHKLPSRSRMLLVLATCLIGYALLELFNFFVVNDLSPAGKLVFNRAGIVVGYLGALVGGLFFYWDQKASQLVSWATAQKERAETNNLLLHALNAEVARDAVAQVPKNESLSWEMKTEIERAETYLDSKPWLGRAAIVLVVLSACMQLIAAT